MDNLDKDKKQLLNNYLRRHTPGESAGDVEPEEPEQKKPQPKEPPGDEPQPSGLFFHSEFKGRY